MSRQIKSNLTKGDVRPGRPSPFDGAAGMQLKQRIALDINDGLTLTEAAELNETSRHAVDYQRHVDPEFDAMLKRAVHSNTKHHLKRIKEGEAQWQSSAWYLERIQRQRFYLQHEAPEENDKPIKLRRMTENGPAIPVPFSRDDGTEVDEIRPN